MKGWKSITNLKDVYSCHWNTGFLRGLIRDKVARKSRSKIQRAFLCNVREIVLYPIGHWKMPKDLKQENNMNFR